MISRKQVNTMRVLGKRGNNFFAPLPNELIRAIVECANGDIAKALQYAAYARKEDAEALIKMLDADPNLLLDKGNVKTPGGDVIEGVTIYEFLLGAGDFELAKAVQSYFSKIKDGEQHKISQYERYKPHIYGIIDQKADNFDLLIQMIQMIKDASHEDVTALLKKDMKRESKLRDALIQFRKNREPRIIKKPCMHYNYSNLLNAFAQLEREWDNLFEMNQYAFDKLNLVWHQVIGFEMRLLPGFDRCVMAQGLYDMIDKKEEVKESFKFNIVRSYKLKDGDSFPITDHDNSVDGLGWDFAVTVFGNGRNAPPPREDVSSTTVGMYVYFKGFKLAELMRPETEYQPTGSDFKLEEPMQSEPEYQLTGSDFKLEEPMQSEPEYQPTGCLIL